MVLTFSQTISQIEYMADMEHGLDISLVSAFLCHYWGHLATGYRTSDYNSRKVTL